MSYKSKSNNNIAANAKKAGIDNNKLNSQEYSYYENKNVGHFLVILSVLVVYQIISAWPVFEGMGWYMELNKPDITPIPWLMRFLWFLALISISASIYSCLDVDLKAKKLKAFNTLLVQLLINCLWTISFFWIQNLYLSLGVGVFSFAVACLCLVYTSSVRPLAGILLIPYILLLGCDNILMMMLYILN